MSSMRPYLFLLMGTIWVFSGSRPAGVWMTVLIVAAIVGLLSKATQVTGTPRGTGRVRPPLPRWVRTAALTVLGALAVLAGLSAVSPAVALAGLGAAVAIGSVFVIRSADPVVIDGDDLDRELAALLAGDDLI